VSNQFRHYRPEIRAVDGSNGRQFWAMPVAYEVVDDYGTIWSRGVFDKSVRERMPVLLYGHDWENIGNLLGKAIDYRDGDDGPRTLFELTAFDEHPHTRQIAAQINDGTLTDMSVGFERRQWEGPGGVRGLADADRELRGPHGAKPVERMLEAGWSETSLVVDAAVPGSKVLTSVRQKVWWRRGASLEAGLAIDVIKAVASGELSHDEGRVALELLATDDGDAGDDVDVDDLEGQVADLSADVEAAIADADAALEGIE
jgi:HK97 family phage prohead protease